MENKRLRTITILATYGICVFLFIVMFLLLVNTDASLKRQVSKNKAWEKSYKVLESETTNKINDCEHIISDLKEKVDEQNTSISNLTKQIETLKNDNLDLRLQVDEYEKESRSNSIVESENTISEQAIITTETYIEPQAYVEPTGGLTPTSGVNYYGGQLETYYNLPMDGVIQQAQNFGIYGEYWVREDGVKMYGDYVILACNRDVHPMGTLVETSLGTGISLDTGGFAESNPNQVDIAVSW